MVMLRTKQREAASTASQTRKDIAALIIKPRLGVGQWISYVLATYLVLLLIQFFVVNENWRWEVIFSYLFSQVVIEGLLNTIYLTVLTTVLGLVIGVITAWCRLSSLVVLRTIALLYIWVMRAMPPLVMLLVVFFFAALVPTLNLGIPFLFSMAEISTNEIITRFSAAIIGLAIYLGAYSAEIFRGGVLSLPPGQFEACKSLGIPPIRAYQTILGPQLIRVITPSLANEVITIFKSTSLVSVIGYAELLTTVQTIYARNFETIPLLMVAVIWYLVLTSIAMFGQSKLEKRFERGFARRNLGTSKTVQGAAAEDFDGGKK